MVIQAIMLATDGFEDSEFGYPYYGKFEAKASPNRAGMKPTNSIQPPSMA